MDRRNTPTGRYRGTTRELDDAARVLRRSMTPAERLLWQALRRKSLDGLRFRRQHPLGPFVVDFCCPARKLVVELDGEVHLDSEHAAQDVYRTEHLGVYGYRVIRFDNAQVLNDLESVLRQIEAALAM